MRNITEASFNLILRIFLYLIDEPKRSFNQKYPDLYFLKQDTVSVVNQYI